MPALDASGSRIDVQQSERAVVLYFQYMGVPGYEELGWIGKQRRAYRRVVIAWVATNMFDKHVDILALESVQLAEHQSQIPTVTVAIDSTQGPECLKPFGYLCGADVASVPYFVTWLKIV